MSHLLDYVRSPLYSMGQGPKMLISRSQYRLCFSDL